MKLRIIIILYLLAGTHLLVLGQQKTVKPLNIGDHVPDFLFQNLKNAAKPTQRASELYRSGLLIINFWATWCVPCVREMPTLNELQKKYSDKLHIISITNQSDMVLTTFLGNHKDLAYLTFSARDTLLKKYFPHTIVPHNIWIDKQGIVQAITGDEQLNEKNILSFINGNTNLATKHDDLEFDWRKPLKVADTEFVHRSIITPQKSSIGNGGVLLPDSNANATRFLAWNRSKTDLFWAAYMKKPMQKRDWNFVEIHTKDSSSFFFPAYTNELNWTKRYGMTMFNEWSGKNLLCYELSFSKKINLAQFYLLMAKELSLYFNVKARVEMKPTDCWVITQLPSKFKENDFKETNREPLQIVGTSMVVKNQTFKEIAEQLSEMYGNEPPFIDLTGIKERISLKKDFADLSEGLKVSMLKDYFNRIGLDINLNKYNYPFLILDDQ
ncbi:TlpA disulfide reductase family protein [Mucilaginibacter sp. 44-25]|uniref:TlpA family protein disulfide reductase n=1 Tax=Mucilaginibacter sp. 44-25 TaxID=1895794 RepID=UPI0009609255|nr:TlpA disulfide reductase family protein [Mucilaginibacter sp. 44-25]OJW14267.1 MAG: hypothetical protein BGO48_09045 [Mucilaginibacter sp. 44-25]